MRQGETGLGKRRLLAIAGVEASTVTLIEPSVNKVPIGVPASIDRISTSLGSLILLQPHRKRAAKHLKSKRT